MTKNLCAGHKGDYFHYICYKTLYDYFKKLKFGKTEEEFLGNTYTELQKNPRDFSAYHEHFKKLATFLNGNHAFITYTLVPSCIYINYWLNKNIKEEHISLYNEKSFEIFNEFAHVYSKIKYKNENNSCREYIRLLTPNEYDKMCILYLLYDLYDQFVSSHPHNHPQPPCDYVGLLARHYWNFLGSEKYKDLFSQLESLKDLIVKRALQINLNCTSTISQITIPKEETRNSVGHDEEKVAKINLPVSSATDPTSVPGISSDRMAITGVVTLPQSTNPEQSEFNPSEKSVKDDTTENQHLVTSQEAAYYAGRTPGERVHGQTQHVQYPRLSEAGFTEQRAEDVYNVLDGFPYRRPHQVDSDTHPEKSVPPMGQPDEVGLLGKIQTTLSGIVSEVEPGPVLGVSGGMGVLFLLFKYTPVGSFFGGRRGRFRQIPRSFNGPFQADFANFQEYDGGLIGYSPMSMSSLAE